MRRWIVRVGLVIACTIAMHAPSDARLGRGYYASKTPYAPQQDSRSYERPPVGFRPVFTQLLARHGARSLASAREIRAVKELLAAARTNGALTDLGKLLDSEAPSFEQANVAVGYGNLTRLGAMEHRRLAGRLLARLPDLFAIAAPHRRRVAVLTSGQGRAVASSAAFVATLRTGLPALGPLIDPPISDPNLLYFHEAPQNADYQKWLAHDPTLRAKLNAIHNSAHSRLQARRLLVRLFSPTFIDGLDAKAVKAAEDIYGWYAAEPGFEKEGQWGFARFVDGERARWFAYLADSSEFYEKGPSFAGATITFKMAQVLQDDFFTAVDALRAAGPRFAARLRFAHAEVVMPFAALMQLPGSEQQVPVNQMYTYADNAWRGATVSPYAANIQWDVYDSGTGQLLVRMLYNEAQARFKATCRSIRPDSYYYRFDELKRCYGYAR